ncbi:MAG: cupredoxin family copper-binding protein [Acidaminococcaceae bacterium]
MKKYHILFLSIITILAFAIIGCGTGKSAQPSGQIGEKNTVTIHEFKFNPAEITIQKGETITWINEDSVTHTVTGTGINSGSLEKGKTFKKTFNETGTFDYICTPHPYMKGKIIVK